MKEDNPPQPDEAREQGAARSGPALNADEQPGFGVPSSIHKVATELGIIFGISSFYLLPVCLDGHYKKYRIMRSRNS
jgi:hypothetical protein